MACFRSSTVFGALLLGLLGQAHSAAESSATISGIRFTLIDLRPGDGIEASFSLLTNANITTFSAVTWNDAGKQSDAVNGTENGTFADVHLHSAAVDGASSQTWLTTDGLSVQGLAEGPRRIYAANLSTGGGSQEYVQNLNLVVSANTVLLIDADYTLSAAAWNPRSCACSATERATASFLSTLNYTAGSDADGVWSTSASTQTKLIEAQAVPKHSEQKYLLNPQTGMYELTSVLVPFLEESKTLSGTFHHTFANFTSVDQRGALGFSVSVQGNSSTAVPEPGSVFLAISGIAAALGSRALRGKR